MSTLPAKVDSATSDIVIFLNGSKKEKFIHEAKLTVVLHEIKKVSFSYETVANQEQLSDSYFLVG
ncbi:hypothetical protein [Leclercia sp.]|uniref:hypothetical protein n=1 Tax=Leclercia sp. TaxID=1898428 RepID=UPI002FDECBA6